MPKWGRVGAVWRNGRGKEVDKHDVWNLVCRCEVNPNQGQRKEKRDENELYD